MLRLSILAVACATLGACAPQQGAGLSAGLDEPQSTGASEYVASTFVPPARVPLPPVRPNFPEMQATAQEQGGQTSVAATQSPQGAQAFAPSVNPQDGATIVRAAFTPAKSPSFDPARGDYAPTEPPTNDGDLQLLPRSDTDPAPSTPRSSAPGQRYYAAYPNTVISCFPPPLQEAINTIADHYGKEVEVTSGYRDHGRRGSYHRRCMAADIRVAGVSQDQLAAFAKTIEGVNGVGTYHHTNITHIDVRDYKMSWRY